MTQQGRISYPLDEFMKHRNNNKNIPQELSPYYYGNSKFNDPNFYHYQDDMKLIISTILSGTDPNDVIFRNEIKYLINTINDKNYGDVLNKLKNMNLSSKENLQFFIHELIVCSMRCPISMKGLFKNRNKAKSLSELVFDIIKYFCTHKIKKNDESSINFHDEFLKMCRKFFMDFVNVSKSMDQNNENTSDNYKGFMTLIGQMFEHNLINSKYITEIVDSIKRTIFCAKVKTLQDTNNANLIACHEKMFGYKKNFSNDMASKIIYYDTNETLLKDKTEKYICYRDIYECSNFYKGYEYLMLHSVNYYENRYPNLFKALEHDKKILEGLNNNNKDVIEKCLKEDNLENNEENLMKLCKEYENNIEEINNKIQKQYHFLGQLRQTHDEFEQLNELFKIVNKEQTIKPLKPYVMIIHNEIKEKLDELYENITKEHF